MTLNRLCAVCADWLRVIPFLCPGGHAFLFLGGRARRRVSPARRRCGGLRRLSLRAGAARGGGLSLTHLRIRKKMRMAGRRAQALWRPPRTATQSVPHFYR